MHGLLYKCHSNASHNHVIINVVFEYAMNHEECERLRSNLSLI